MKKTINLDWNICNEVIASEERYCPACGKKALFSDSLIRRQNANGKNIYHFAIYKCEKDHTWNKQLGTFKALSGLENNPLENQRIVSDYETINLENYIKEGFQFIHINILSINSKERFDKFMSDKLAEISRNEIIKHIKNGAIRINEEPVKPNKIVKDGDKISLDLMILKSFLTYENLEYEGATHGTGI